MRPTEQEAESEHVDQELLGIKVVQDEIAQGLPLPSRGREKDVAYDIPIAEDVTIPPLNGADVRTGIRVVPPDGYYLRVVGKGSSARRGLSFALEIIDPGYRGEVILHPWNGSPAPVHVKRGQCIAQLELIKITPSELVQVDASQLDQTDRGEGRMNSTGRGLE